MYVGLNRSAEELGITEYSTLVMSDCDPDDQYRKANGVDKGVFTLHGLSAKEALHCMVNGASEFVDPDSHSVFFPKASRCVILFPLHFNKFSKTLLTIFTYRGIFLVNPTDFVDWLKSIYKMWSVITVRPSTSVRKSPRKN